MSTVTVMDERERARERAAAREALFRLRRMSSDDPEYLDLREHVISEYMSYARYLADKYQQRGESLQDLEQVASTWSSTARHSSPYWPNSTPGRSASC